MLHRHTVKAIPASSSQLYTRGRKVGIGAVAALLCVAVGAHAATITVNTTADDTTPGDGLCTLSEAIANVNAAADTSSGDCAAGTANGDTIVFNLILPATITSTPLTISADVTISGPTTGPLAIDGSGRVAILDITAGSVSIRNLSLQNGNGSAGGFGGPAGGINISKGASATVADCTLSGNYSDPSGGAIFIEAGGTATLTNCTLNGNSVCGSGGGIYSGGMVTLTNCTLSNNGTDGGYGGGIFVDSGGTATLTNCTLSGNSGDEEGGGILINGGTASLTNCTIAGNSTLYDAGGGLSLNGGTATLTNCTLSGNAAYGAGGGLDIAAGTATLTNCTLSGNSMDPDGFGVSGISVASGATAMLINTIVARQSEGGVNCEAASTNGVLSGGHNLDSDGTCFTSGGTDVLNTDPRLAPLGYYGGPTATMALCSGVGVPDVTCPGASPAIDSGNDAVTGPPDSLTTDQRGLPRKSGLHVDMGAYELQPHDRVPVCVGDCNGDQQVSVDELLTMVNIALGTADIASCPAGDANHDNQITIDEILAAVHRALNGCA